MTKVALAVVLAVIIAAVSFFAVSACAAWLKALFDTERNAVRDETREARWAREDLEDAVARAKRRKK